MSVRSRLRDAAEAFVGVPVDEERVLREVLTEVVQRELGGVRSDLKKGIGNEPDKKTTRTGGNDRHPLEGDMNSFGSEVLDYLRGGSGRVKLYNQYDQMEDSLPEAGAVLDMYADYATSGSMTAKGADLEFFASESKYNDQIDFAVRRAQLTDLAWPIARQACKYGDSFWEPVVSPRGLSALENRPARTISKKKNKKTGEFEGWLQKAKHTGLNKDVELEMWQIAHFMLCVDPSQEYGQSILFNVRRVGRLLGLLFDGIAIARLTKSIDRYKWIVDVGGLSKSGALSYLRKFKLVTRRKLVVEPTTGNMSMRDNPLRTSEDLYVPRSPDGVADVTRITGDRSMSRIADLELHHDRFFIGTKTHRSWFTKGVSFDSSTSTALLNFIRASRRVRQTLKTGYDHVLKVHLRSQGVPLSVLQELDIRIKFPIMSYADELMKLKVDQARLQVGALMRQGQYMSRRDTMVEVLQMDEEVADRLLKSADKDRPPLPPGAPPGASTQTPKSAKEVAEQVLELMDEESTMHKVLDEIRDLAAIIDESNTGM